MYFIGETILIKAAKYYKLAAAENHTQAMYNLALMYREGEGVKQDTGKAIDLMERAAEQGLAQVWQGKSKGPDKLSQLTCITIIVTLL